MVGSWILERDWESKKHGYSARSYIKLLDENMRYQPGYASSYFELLSLGRFECGEMPTRRIESFDALQSLYCSPIAPLLSPSCQARQYRTFQELVGRARPFITNLYGGNGCRVRRAD